MPADQKYIYKAKKALEAAWAAKDAYHTALAKAYPIGARTYYSHGEHWVPCEVVGHSRGDLIVVGENSGKKYRIGGYRFHS